MRYSCTFLWSMLNRSLYVGTPLIQFSYFTHSLYVFHSRYLSFFLSLFVCFSFSLSPSMRVCECVSMWVCECVWACVWVCVCVYVLECLLVNKIQSWMRVEKSFSIMPKRKEREKRKIHLNADYMSRRPTAFMSS